MAKSTRRQWLKGGLALGGLTLFGASYSEMVQKVFTGLRDGSSGKSAPTPCRPKGVDTPMAGRPTHSRQYR